MKDYVYIIIGFICGVFVSFSLKIMCQCKRRRRNKVDIIMTRRPNIKPIQVLEIRKVFNNEVDNISIDYSDSSSIDSSNNNDEPPV